MEYKFKAGDFVKAPGLSRPCAVLSVRTADRVFKGRQDSEGTKKELAEPWYTVQIDGSSSTRFHPESKLTRIAPADLEGARAEADPLPTGAAQGITGGSQPKTMSRIASDTKALREEKARLLAEMEERVLRDEVASMKAQLAMKEEPGTPVQ